MRGRVELAALLAFRAGELGEEVLVDAAEDVLGAIRRTRRGRCQLTRLISWPRRGFVEARAGEVLREDALEGRVVALDGVHGVVDRAADRGLRGLGLEVGPAGLARHPEDAGGSVFVGVFGVGAFGSGGRGGQVGVLGLERIARCT